MDIKVKDIFENLNMEGFELIAGKGGINRSIKAISIIDAPDGYKWLKGGEFVVTTAYMVKDNLDDLMELIININNAGVSAFGIKIHRYINELPDSIINLANELNLPLISIPNEVPYAEIIHMVTLDMFDLQTRRLYISEKIHNSFTNLVIKGGDTQEIVNELSSLIHKDVCFYDNFFRKFYYNSTFDSLGADIENLSLENLLEKYKNYKIKVKNNSYGYLIIFDNQSQEQIENFEEIAIEHAMMVLILDIQKRISNYEIQSKYRDKLLQDLIFNNIHSVEEVDKRASIYGWKFDKPAVSIVIDIDNFKEKYLQSKDFEKIDESLKLIRKKMLSICKSIYDQFYSSVYTCFSDKFVFVIQFDCNYELFNKKINRLSNLVQKRIKEETKLSATIGIGLIKESILEISDSFDEALKSVKLGRKMYKADTIIFFDDLKVYRLLDSISDKKCIEEFYNKYLLKLTEYDQKNNSNLLCTLECLSKNDWNMNSVAKILFIHYNTIKYRVTRISEILEIDIKDSRQKFNIDLAFKLYNLYK